MGAFRMRWAETDWSVAAFEPFIEERRERMHRLRTACRVLAQLKAEFGPEERARRERASAKMAVDPG